MRRKFMGWLIKFDTDFSDGNGLMIPKVIKVDLYQPQLCSRTNKSIGIFFVFIYPPQDQKYNFVSRWYFLRIPDL